MTQVNIYDTANQLERDLRATKEFEALKQAHALVQANETSRELFKQFTDHTKTMQELTMRGESPTEEMIQTLQTMSQTIAEDDNIKQLVEAERQLSILMEDINRIVTTPLSEIYN